MNNRKVLIIDDDADLCLLMKTYFLRKNFEVCMAHTSSDALATAKVCQPEFIFLTTAVCQNPQEDIKKIKEVVPAAEIILDGYKLRQ